MENVNWEQIFYYRDLVAYAKYLENHYKGLVTYNVIGRSADGRDIFLLILGSGKENIILTGGVHGRESVNPMVLLSMAEHYCEKFKEYLSKVCIYMVPLLNPDGYCIATEGYESIRSTSLRKNIVERKIPNYLWKYNARGVDINRNFPCVSWQKKSITDSAGSEVETKALMELFQEVSSVGFIDYHSRGKQIYYHRQSMSKQYNEEQYRLACLLNALTGYELVLPSEEIEKNDTGGNTVHYYSEQIKKPAITIETVDELAIFPLQPHYQKITFQEILFTPFIFCPD